MNSLKSQLVWIVCLFLNFSYSQTGPGGVGNSANNALWLKADSGTSTTISGQPINLWNDISGNLNNASQTNINQQPLYYDSVINGYPSILFDYSQTSGQNDFLSGDDASNLDNTNGLTVFSVVRPTHLGNARSIISKRTDVGNNQSYMFFFFNSNYYYVDIDGNNNRFSTSNTTFNSNTNYIISTLYDGTLPTSSRVKVFSGETLITTASESSDFIPDYNSPFTVGATHKNDSRGFGGYISELVIYRKALNTAERIIVNNYLSSKYNEPLTSNDIYVQDDASNGNFDHNVAGIGQATDGSNHTDSQGTGIVRISNPTALNNNEFLFWGEETKNPTYNFSTNTINYTEQLNSRWRVSRQGNLGTVTVSFDLSNINLAGKQSCSTLQLVVDNNYDFSSPEEVYNLSIVGTTATATGVTFSNNRYFTLRYTDQIVWDGSNFYNGSGTANNPCNTDQCYKLTIKAGTTVTLTENAYVREVKLETGATLKITNGILLETENQILNNGTIDLLGEAQLIQHHSGMNSNSGTGSLIIRQQGTSNLFNYNYWSSPVNRNGTWKIGYLEDATGPINFTSGLNGNALTSPITVSNKWLYTFKGPIGNYYYWSKISTSNDLVPGVGYTMKGSGATTTEQEFVFKGTPNSGDYILPVASNTEYLIGNPYPSTLDANQFIIDNESIIDGTLYFWESFSTNNSHYLSNYEGGYATYNLMMPLAAIADASGLISNNGTASKAAPTRYINVGQGFFTKILNSGNITFNNAQRSFAKESLNETIYYKTNSKSKAISTEDTRPKIWFTFTDPNGYTKYLGLGYDQSTTYGYDRGYDAKTYDSFKNDINWLVNDESLIIQAIPEINLEDQLPLALKVTNAGSYKFGIDKMENIPDDLHIYLLDNAQNIYYDLRNNETKLFLNTGADKQQFSIVFKKSSLLDTTTFDNKGITTTYNAITKTLELHTTNLLSSVESFKIYNIIGQEVLSIKSPKSNTINVSQLGNGVYILKVETTTNNDIESFKFLKY
ncbi:T9SS type A sorting domain-containing protein [Mariniflexile sp.]|uniref:T9SS type A sorting domain-containing protein n=1 Tax=Mariniflexile sp. TaxID=1979402 RepID=UPI003564A0FD